MVHQAAVLLCERDERMCDARNLRLWFHTGWEDHEARFREEYTGEIYARGFTLERGDSDGEDVRLCVGEIVFGEVEPDVWQILKLDHASFLTEICPDS